MKNIRLSIIIPYYNSVEELKQLLDSIPNIEEIQVIVVDDFSNLYQKEYETCKKQYSSGNVEFYINECGKSAGGARNTGLKYAKGQWLLFADSDDKFLVGFYDIVRTYFESGYELIYFIPTSVEVCSGKESNRHLTQEKFICKNLEDPSLKNQLELKYSCVAPWSKLYRRSLFDENDIKFDETIVANDVMAIVKAAYHAKEIFVSPEKIYCITKRENSLETTLTLERFKIRLDVFIRKHQYLKANLPREEYVLVNFKAMDRLGVCADNWGWGYFLLFLFRLLAHGVPVWKEWKIYQVLFKRKNELF